MGNARFKQCQLFNLVTIFDNYLHGGDDDSSEALYF